MGVEADVFHQSPIVFLEYIFISLWFLREYLLQTKGATARTFISRFHFASFRFAQLSSIKSGKNGELAIRASTTSITICCHLRKEIDVISLRLIFPRFFSLSQGVSRRRSRKKAVLNRDVLADTRSSRDDIFTDCIMHSQMSADSNLAQYQVVPPWHMMEQKEVLFKDILYF